MVPPSVAQAETLRVLLVEDNPADVRLLLHELRRAGFEVDHRCVETRQAFLAELERPHDVILADYTLPGFTAPEALALVQRRGLDVPFVVVTGTVGEEIAVDCMKQGAADCLLKDRLGRLGEAVRGALAARDAREERRRATEEAEAERQRLLDLFDASPTLMCVFRGPDHVYERVNPPYREIVDVPDPIGWRFRDVFPNEDLRDVAEILDHIFRTGEPARVEEFPFPVGADREVRYYNWVGIPLRDHGGGVEGILVSAVDISEQVRARQEVERSARVVSRLNRDLERRLEHLAALRETDVAISASVDLQLTLRVLLEQAIKHLEVDAAAVLLYHADSLTLRHAASRGVGHGLVRSTQLRLGEGQAGRAAYRRERIRLDGEGFQAAFGRTPLATEAGFRSYCAVPLVAKGEIQGVLELFHREEPDGSAEWLEFLDALAVQGAIAIDGARMLEDLQRSNLDLSLAYDSTIEGWARALDLRDEETEGHSRRVTELCVALARQMGLSEEELVHVQRGALLHDIGKMGVPDRILLKPGKLTEEEWEQIRRHPTLAYELLAPIAFLKPALDIPNAHHERWDGSGYPRGLAGEDIPLAARIFAVVDVWDALTSDRPYREAWPEERARALVREEAGRHFDPAVVEAFLELLAQRGT